MFPVKMLKIFKIYTNDIYFTFHVNIYLSLQNNKYVKFILGELRLVSRCRSKM